MATLRIKELSKQKGIPLNVLAEKVGISATSLSCIITGKQKPSFDTLERLSDSLNVPISALFEAKRDFIAFVRRNGETFTFESEGALKAYAETLPASTDK